MKRDERITSASDENEKDDAWIRAFWHSEQHEYSDVDIYEARSMKENRRITSAIDENEKKSVESEAFKRANQNEQIDVDILESSTIEEGWRAARASHEDEKENVRTEEFRDEIPDFIVMRNVSMRFFNEILVFCQSLKIRW